MNIFEQLTTENRITPPFNYKVKLNNTTFSISDVEEIQFNISFTDVLVRINGDLIASFDFKEHALQQFGVKEFVIPTNEELTNMPGTHTYSHGSNSLDNHIVFFVTDEEGFDDKINLNVIFKNILHVLKKAYKRKQKQAQNIF